METSLILQTGSVKIWLMDGNAIGVAVSADESVAEDKLDLVSLKQFRDDLSRLIAGAEPVPTK